MVGASSRQVVSMLTHSAFISAHLLYFSGFPLFVFFSPPISQVTDRLSCEISFSPHSPPHGTAVLRVLMVCCRRTVGASTACSSAPWESNWEPRFGRPQECDRCCTVTHLSLQPHTLHTSTSLILLYIHNTSLRKISLHVN